MPDWITGYGRELATFSATAGPIKRGFINKTFLHNRPRLGPHSFSSTSDQETEAGQAFADELTQQICTAAASWKADKDKEGKENKMERYTVREIKHLVSSVWDDDQSRSSTSKNISLGSPNLLLKGHFPAKFSSKPNPTHLNKLNKVL